MTRRSLALFAACAAFASSAAPAATLIHSYDFNGATVIDGTGAANGTLSGNASLSGGLAHFDGSANTFIQLSAKIIPTGGAAFSLYFKYDTTNLTQPYGIVEIVSQGFSGGPGFYVGIINGQTRLTDNYSGGLGDSFLSGAHDFLLTSGGGNGTQVYFDGALHFSSVSDLGLTGGGDNTRLGNQFGSYLENFNGALDDVRVYSGIASYAEASGAVPEPASWALMIGGLGLCGAAMRRRAVMRLA